jgi:hypothetical protein
MLGRCALSKLSVRHTRFREFVEKLEAGLPDEAAIASAVSAATHAFEGFEAITKAVMSPELEGRWLTEPLNLDAGTHPIPLDAREVQVALRAGEASFARWSYYGKRGLAFTRSDSCWLVTLVREDPSLAARHVRWLANVLAARGMPALLLEQHLELSHDHLCAFVPERASHYRARGALR